MAEHFPEEINVLMAQSDGTYVPYVPICDNLTWGQLRGGEKYIGRGNILAVEFTEGLRRPVAYSFNIWRDLTKAELLKEVVQKYADLVFEGRRCISAEAYDAFQTRAFYGLERTSDSFHRPIMGADPSRK